MRGSARRHGDGRKKEKEVVMTQMTVAEEREGRNGKRSESLPQASLSHRAARGESRGEEMGKIKSSG